MSIDDELGLSIAPHVLDVDIAFPSARDTNTGAEEDDGVADDGDSIGVP